MASRSEKAAAIKRGAEAARTATDPEKPKKPQAAENRGTLLCDIKPNLTSNYIVKGLILYRAFGAVHADSSGGKTAILVDMMLHIAAGMTYRGRRVKRQPVVYVALEGHGGIDNRVYAAAHALGIADAPFKLLKISSSFRDPEPAKLVADIANGLMNTFGGDCPVIVIDTFTAALGAGASDCDPKDVTGFIANVQAHLLTNSTVIVAHHFGKDQSRGGRGWSGLRAALDFEMEIDQDGDLRVMRLTKNRDGSDRQPAFCYRFHALEVGVDQDGDPVTAVVVEHLADEDAAKPGKRLSSKAWAALNCLWRLIKSSGESWPMSDPPGLRCTVMALWEKAAIAPGVITQAKEEKERRRKFKSAVDELLAASEIVIDGERVYPAPKRSVAGGGKNGS